MCFLSAPLNCVSVGFSFMSTGRLFQQEAPTVSTLLPLDVVCLGTISNPAKCCSFDFKTSSYSLQFLFAMRTGELSCSQWSGNCQSSVTFNFSAMLLFTMRTFELSPFCHDKPLPSEYSNSGSLSARVRFHNIFHLNIFSRACFVIVSVDVCVRKF